MTPVKEALIAARALISDIEHWTQGKLAVDRIGGRVDVLDAAAYAFCADGAIIRAAGGCMRRSANLRLAVNPVYREAIKALDAAAAELYGTTIVSVNDDGRGVSYAFGNHEAVLRAFDRAIALA